MRPSLTEGEKIRRIALAASDSRGHSARYEYHHIVTLRALAMYCSAVRNDAGVCLNNELSGLFFR